MIIFPILPTTFMSESFTFLDTRGMAIWYDTVDMAGKNLFAHREEKYGVLESAAWLCIWKAGLVLTTLHLG